MGREKANLSPVTSQGILHAGGANDERGKRGRAIFPQHLAQDRELFFVEHVKDDRSFTFPTQPLKACRRLTALQVENIQQPDALPGLRLQMNEQIRFGHRGYRMMAHRRVAIETIRI